MVEREEEWIGINSEVNAWQTNSDLQSKIH